MKHHDHKWFARYWNWQLRAENQKIRELRKRVAGGARGRVLEIGCGAGANFDQYGAEASEVIASDPNRYMVEIGGERAKKLGRAIEVREARAEDLPFGDASFDTVVSTANMCSIDRPEQALAEIWRVLIPGGEYRFFDHVRSEDNRVLAFWQDVLTPFHRRILSAGCRLNRRTGSLIEEAGFSSVLIEHCKPLPTMPMAVYRPHIVGVATR